ncbi:MAG TPA: site-specific integrase, partial [Trebonia sp.]
VHQVIRRALNQAVHWGWLNANPALRASAPKARQAEITPPSARQVARLMDVAWARNPDFAAYLALAAATGARRGEMCGLRHSDFDPAESTLLIARAIVQVGREMTVKGTKTDRLRRITLDEDTAAVLVAHLERSKVRFVRAAANPYIFSRSADGAEHLKPGNVSTNWRHLCRSAGVKGVRLHDLRHYHGTGLLTAGVDVRTVAGRLGHANPSMTLKVYGHFMPAADAAAAAVWKQTRDAVQADAKDPRHPA